MGAFCAKGSRAKYESRSKKSTGKPTAQSWAKAPKNDYVQSMVKRYAPALASKQDNAQTQTAAVNRVEQFANKEPASRAQFMADYFTGKVGDFKKDWGVSRNLTRNEAAALLGNYAVETGSRTFQNPDIVERNNGGAGRGLAQYSHARRLPYDAARQQHINNGGNPNDIDWQLRYAGEEFRGLHDPGPGQSLIGWRNTFGRLPGPDASISQLSRHFERNYFAPSQPHSQRRIDAAQHFLRTLNW
ncbi:MAG: phage tail tip lysozyme [Myxococcota bacterium]|nr:phage tail tip lysozyme [Myxococcota bacterium]